MLENNRKTRKKELNIFSADSKHSYWCMKVAPQQYKIEDKWNITLSFHPFLSNEVQTPLFFSKPSTT